MIKLEKLNEHYGILGNANLLVWNKMPDGQQ